MLQWNIKKIINWYSSTDSAQYSKKKDGKEKKWNIIVEAFYQKLRYNKFADQKENKYNWDEKARQYVWLYIIFVMHANKAQMRDDKVKDINNRLWHNVNGIIWWEHDRFTTDFILFLTEFGKIKIIFIDCETYYGIWGALIIKNVFVTDPLPV